MKQHTNRPQEEDLRNFPIESGIEKNNETEFEMYSDSKLIDDDPDEENKVGLDSPWNIFS